MHRHIKCALVVGLLTSVWTAAARAQQAPRPQAQTPAPSTVRPPDPVKTVPATPQTAPRANEPPADAPRRAWIGHIPVQSARVGPVTFAFDVDNADLAGAILVRYRPLSQPGAQPVELEALRTASGVSVRADLGDQAPPGIAYWVVERMPDGTEWPIFASQRNPHVLNLRYSPVRERERAQLQRTGGRRSSVSVGGEYVNLGGWEQEGGGELRDHYWHTEARYAYRFFRTLDTLEIGLGALRGTVLDHAQRDGRSAADDGFRQRDVGLEYGRARITLAFGKWVRVQGGVLFGFSKDGFEGGGDGAVVFGHRDGTDVKLFGAYVSGVGGAGGVRLGWATVPRVPMGATVEVTNYGANDRAGARLLFDAGYELYPGALLKVVGGYRGRTSLAGGMSLGADLQLSF